MAQLPSQGIREPGRKVCSRAWLPLLAGFAATHKESALQKLHCLLTAGEHLKQEKSTLMMRFWIINLKKKLEGKLIKIVVSYLK